MEVRLRTAAKAAAGVLSRELPASVNQ